MTRIHCSRRGKSHSTRPPSTTTGSWITYSPDEVVAIIGKLVKNGLKPSEIGIALRDEHGIPSVRTILGKGLAEVLKEHEMNTSPPEDIAKLLEKAKALQTHLNNHPGDRKNVRSLELVEAQIHRLSKYYKRKGNLPKSWKYSTVVAQLE